MQTSECVPRAGGPVAFLLALGGILAGPAAAEAPAVHALVGVRIVTAPGEVVESGTVVVRDGVIAAAGAGVATPPDARVWERPGLTVYAGFVEPYLERGWPEEVVPVQGSHGNAQVQARRRMALHAFDAAAAESLRRAGFTTALVAPSEGVLRGRGALLNLGEFKVPDAGGSFDSRRGEGAESALQEGLRTNLLSAEGPHFLAFEPSREHYPESLMGVVALVRQTLLDARWYAEARESWRTGPGPTAQRPPYDADLEALEGLAAGREPAYFVTEGVEDSLLAARLADEADLEALLVGNGGEYQRLEALRRAGLATVLPLDFPEPPDVGDSGDAPSVELAQLRHWQEAPDNPRRLLEAGLTVAFTSHGLKEPRQIFERLSRAIERGLTPEQALAALTTTPAKLLGMEGRLGTVTAGKMANLLVVEGDLWVAEPKLVEVWIDGRRYEVAPSEKPAPEDVPENGPERKGA